MISRALPLLLALALLAGCSRSATITNTTERPIRATLERELMGSGDRTLDAATIAPDGEVTLGPVTLLTERVTLIVRPGGGPGGEVPIKERLGFGSSESTVVDDEFAPATIRLIEGTPEAAPDQRPPSGARRD